MLYAIEAIRLREALIQTDGLAGDNGGTNSICCASVRGIINSYIQDIGKKLKPDLIFLGRPNDNKL